MTDFERRATQELNSISRATWAIAILIAIGLLLSSLASASSTEEAYDEELDAHYAVAVG